MHDLKIAVICVYNNALQLKEQLIASLNKQDIQYDLICLDNTKQQFSSASKALNYAAKQTDADVLIFTHQDVFIKKENGIREFASAVMDGEIGNIYGSSGARENEKNNIGAYTSGLVYNRSFVSQPDTVQRVSCLDECFFGMKKETYCMYTFDEALCDDWHLYCVEMCLRARKAGKGVFMVPIQLHHFSKGHVTWNYMKCLKKLASTYRPDFRYIWTTVYKVRTTRIYINTLTCLWYLNRKIRNKPI